MRTNRSVPSATVIPSLEYPDVTAAVEWLCRVFGFTLRIRMGDHRAQLAMGDGAVVVRDRTAPDTPFAPAAGQSVLVRVESVDDHLARTTKEGATVIRAPQDYPYGERQYSVRDLAGYLWTFSESIADVAPEEWGGTRH